MEELPDLPFEQIVSHLSLDDRLKCRSVSRGWRNKFDSCPLKWFCFSMKPIEHIFQRRRWVNGSFARNFISLTRFTSLTFDSSMLSGLKRLRLCDLRLNEEDRSAFVRGLNSFGQLQELDIIRLRVEWTSGTEVNLPMLYSIHLEDVHNLRKLTLDAPRLKDIKLKNYSGFNVDLVHGNSVERLIIHQLDPFLVRNLNNLQYLYTGFNTAIEPTLLSNLKQLKEIHLQGNRSVSAIFEQKQRYGRGDLKIYLWGLLLSGPDDPAIHSLYNFNGNTFRCLVENPSRIADEIPLVHSVDYKEIERLAFGSEMNFLKRFPDLREIRLKPPVQNAQRYLTLLKNFDNIEKLELCGELPQDLFDRLPEHSAVQWLDIENVPADCRFLLRMKTLICLLLSCSINTETVQNVLEELPLLSRFFFHYRDQWIRMGIHRNDSNPFRVWIGTTQVRAATPTDIIRIIEEGTR